MIKIGKIEIRPEVEKFVYWIHITLLAIIVKFIMGNFGYCGTEIFVKETLYLWMAIAISDISVHTILQLD